MTRNGKIAAWSGGILLGLMVLGAATDDQTADTASSGPAISWEDPAPSVAGGDTMAVVNEATELVREVSSISAAYTGASEASVCGIAMPLIEPKMARLEVLLDEMGPLAEIDAGSGTVRDNYSSMEASFATVTAICGGG